MIVCHHTYVEEYYGCLCTACGLFYPYGCAPWEDHEFDDDEHEPEEDEDRL